METVFDYFISSLISDMEDNPRRYASKSPLDIARLIQSFYSVSSYENLADIEDMTEKERRKWMREYV